VQKKVTSEIIFKGYKRHASKQQPQYIIKSDKTDHVAIHKGSALKEDQEEMTCACDEEMPKFGLESNAELFEGFPVQPPSSPSKQSQT
jgi:hypothetical protein